MASIVSLQAEAARRHGLWFLPKIFSRNAAGDVRAAPPRYHLLLAAGILLPPLALAIHLGFAVFPGRTDEGHAAHALVEGFCALNALVLFYVLYQGYLLSANRRLELMALGFLALGIFDLFHVVSIPGSDGFVWFRSLAALLCAGLLCASLDRRAQRAQGATGGWAHAAIVALGMIVFGLLGMLFERFLPVMLVEGNFTAFAVTMNALAGALFLVAGCALYRDFRHSGEWVLFVFAVGMFLFAESQGMFAFSKIWDASWWAWHGMRAVIFIGIVLGLAHEYVQGLRELEASQRTLIEAEKLASLGEMAAAVAHEIRNPLATITNSLGLLKDRRLSRAETDEIHAILEQEVNRLNHIVADTLSFAHPKTGRNGPVDLGRLIRETVSRAQALHPRVRFEADVASDVPMVAGDPDQLVQALWNLVDNAVAAVDGSGRVRVAVTREGAKVSLMVEDNGPGIAADLREQILQPFFSTKPKGTGLGLPIVQRIAQDHAGSLRIDSRPGAGACVALLLPAMSETADTPVHLSVVNR